MAIIADPGLRRLLVQACAGGLVGWAVLAGLLLTDAAGLATIILGSDLRAVALAVLALQFAAGFAVFTVATAMAMPQPGRPRGRTADPQPRPVVVRRPRR
ncbi:MAG: hypothetical protein AB7I59_27295 [Geminicoccaceae bacterium]